MPESTGTLASVLSEYLTKHELAQQLGRSTRTIDRMALGGGGPPITRIGRTKLYRRVAVIEWLHDRETSAPGRNSPTRKRLRVAVEQ
jgi:hypothetical protein